MRIAVLANDDQWGEINTGINYADYTRIDSFENIPADMEACLFLRDDMEYDFEITSKPILINAVSFTLKEINAPGNIIRINGWNSFLSRGTWEMSGSVNESVKQVFAALKKQMIPVPDEPGFVSARVIAMIINEAYFALEDKVSTKEEIDIAMKLGTNYPYGPFEWASLIGADKIFALLQKLSLHDKKIFTGNIFKISGSLMSIILNIDTAIDVAYISISKNGEIIEQVSNEVQKDHGAFLQPAILAILKNISISIQELDAIAISAGPGSYTGLRVGMASAKGICYALKKPLITLGTLEILAFAAILETGNTALTGPALYCPMIDARRMEVFTAIYDQHLEPVLYPFAMILEENSFANRLLKNKIIFLGNGAKKWEHICRHENALFFPVRSNSLAMSKLAFKKYENNDFADLAYSEPFYLKEFFGGPGQN